MTTVKVGQRWKSKPGAEYQESFYVVGNGGFQRWLVHLSNGGERYVYEGELMANYEEVR